MTNSNVPAPVAFQLVRSDVASWTFDVTFPASAPSADLNAYDISFTARSDYGDAVPVFALTKSGGQITVDPVVKTRGYIALSSDNSEYLACPPPLYSSQVFFDLELMLTGSDKPSTIARGTILFVADVTRNL